MALEVNCKIRMKLYTPFRGNCTPYSGEAVHAIPGKLYTPLVSIS